MAGTGSSASELPGSQPAYYQGLGLGFVLVEIDGDTLTAEFVDTSGATLFSRTLTKPD